MRRIHGRRCVVTLIDSDKAITFAEKNHRDGFPRTVTKVVAVGLEHEGEIVGIAIFSSPRTAAKKKKYTTELLRMCFLPGVRVMGGASKLIRYYIRLKEPADVFTYQDMSGEGSKVYEHCGFTLVSQAKKKDYLVAPGKTLETATRKEALGMAYAVRYGPDRITGSSLGEIVGLDGKRKSNKDIFIEDLGWHVETTDGDVVWEWFNPDRTYYIYRLTAAESEKYYIGVRQVKKREASLEDCAHDIYWGSGTGEHLKNWRKKAISEKKLKKEVLAIFSTQAQAYAFERELIGELWRTDSNCLNSCHGGKAGGINHVAAGKSFLSAHCDTCQTVTVHNGSVCISCRNRKSLNTSYCPECSRERIHLGSSCSSCAAKKAFSILWCKSCDEPRLHRGSKCQTCTNRGKVKIIWCSTCSEYRKHQGSTCSTCNVRDSIGLKLCSKHGETKHQGAKCSKCNSESSVSYLWCEECQKTTKHQGSVCCLCRNMAVINKAWCDSCNAVTSHLGRACYVCISVPNLRHCEKCNKDTKHNGNSCATCAVPKVYEAWCSTCKKEQKHKGGSCCACANQKELKKCGICDRLTSHSKSGACMACASKERAHEQWHVKRDKRSPDCRFCAALT